MDPAAAAAATVALVTAILAAMTVNAPAWQNSLAFLDRGAAQPTCLGWFANDKPVSGLNSRIGGHIT